MEYNVFNPYVFRKCQGWKDMAGEYQISPEHEEYFVVPPAEHLMPDAVPRKVRCKSCEIKFRRYQTLIRVRRYRINLRQKEIVRNYIKAYQASLTGEINLPPNILNQLKCTIIENGGTLESNDAGEYDHIKFTGKVE